MSETSALSPFEELIQSKLFTFRVGKDEGMKEFTVHSKAVAATSPYFYATVNNGMKESQEGTGKMSDVQPEDFARFIEYAYRHDYTVPSWVQEEKHGEDGSASPPPPPVENHWSGKDEPEPEVPAGVESAFGAPFGAPFGTSFGHQGAFLNGQNQTFFGSSPMTKKKKSKKSAQSDFDERNYLPSIQPKTIMLTAFEPQHNTTSDQNFTPVFLAHARLYTFARTHFVDPLKCLTLHKLHRTLLGFRLYERRVHDVVELARYAYQQNADRKEDGTIDELRKLVVDYTVREVLTFGKHPDFVALLSEGGELVEDFLGVLYKEKLS